MEASQVTFKKISHWVQFQNVRKVIIKCLGVQYNVDKNLLISTCYQTFSEHNLYLHIPVILTSLPNYGLTRENCSNFTRL